MRYLFLSIVIVALVFSFYYSRNLHPLASQQQKPPTSSVLGKQTKTTGCIPNDKLPDSSCTPGDFLPNATTSDICKPGYSSSIRNVPQALKQEVYAEYGIPTHRPGEYEVDHLISLELGGSNDISNLWPEPAEPRPGFHEKDAVENYLHEQICNGNLSLQDAQKQISTNWLSVYNSIQNPQVYQFHHKGK